MNLDYLETFYWAATFKSITDAAKKMHIVPQAATQRIKIIEQALQVSLADRQPFRLTRAGETFLTEAMRMLAIWNQVRGELGSSPGAASTLRIGTMESVLHSWLIPWIEEMRVQRSSFELEITVETTSALHDLVRRGAIDLVFSADAFHADGMCTRALPALPMVFVGDRVRHTQDSYTLAELASLGILTFQRGSQPHTQLLGLLRQERIESARVHAISSVSAMLRLVPLGFGVATLPSAAIAELSPEQRLKPLFCSTRLIDLPVYASWRADPISQVIDTLVDSACAFVTPRNAQDAL